MCDTCGMQRYFHGAMFDHAFTESIDVLGILAKYADDPYPMGI